MTEDQWQDRRMADAEWRKHVDRRLDAQDETLNRQNRKLDKIDDTLIDMRTMLGVFNAGKVGAALFKWVVAIGAGLAAIWGGIHLGGK